MLPDPRQYNPEFYQHMLDLLSPYFQVIEGPEWDETAQMYYDWCYQYEEVHYPIGPVEVEEVDDQN